MSIPCIADVSRVRGYTGDIRMARPGTVAYHKHLKCLIVKCKVNVREKMTGTGYWNS